MKAFERPAPRVVLSGATTAHAATASGSAPRRYAFKRALAPAIAACATLVAAATAGVAVRWWRATRSSYGDVSTYRLAGCPKVIETGMHNASGLTYHPGLRCLYLVTNAPPTAYRLDLAGKIIDHVDLVGFEDTEGIAHLGGDYFAVTEERRRTVAIVEIVPGATSCGRAGALVVPFGAGTNNRGLEGITYDPVGRRIIVANESGPRRVFVLKWPGPVGVPARPLEAWTHGGTLPGCLLNFSGIDVDHETGHFLLLSRHGRSIGEFLPGGDQVGNLSLRAGSAGLADPITRAEGIALTDRGVLYLCSEPNLLYRFLRTPATPRVRPRAHPAGRPSR